MKTSCIILSLFGLSFAGCDTLGYGYVNRLSQPVTVTRSDRHHSYPLVLAAHARRMPMLGDSIPERVSFSDSEGRLIGIFASADRSRVPRSSPSVLLIERTGISEAPGASWHSWHAEVQATGFQRRP